MGNRCSQIGFFFQKYHYPYSQCHTIVLFVRSAASEEGDDEDETSNYDQKRWHTEELWIEDFSEVMICSLHCQPNGQDCDTSDLNDVSLDSVEKSAVFSKRLYNLPRRGN